MAGRATAMLVLAIATGTMIAGCGSSSHPAPAASSAPVTASEVPPESVNDGGAAPPPSGRYGPAVQGELHKTYPVMTSFTESQSATVTLNSVSAAKTLLDQDKPPQHGWYVTFDVTFQATTEGAQPGGQFAFFVREADGTQYQSAVYGGPHANTLPNNILHVGEKATGTVTFDVPSAHGTLGYTTAYEASSSQVEWKF